MRRLPSDMPPGITLNRLRSIRRRSKTQWQRVDRSETGFDRFGGEAGPPVDGRSQVGVHDRLTGGVGFQTRPFVVLQLEQFEQAGALTRRRHHPQVPQVVGEEDAGDIGKTELHAPVGKPGQQIDDVEVVDK